MTEGGIPVCANRSCAPSQPALNQPETPTATPEIVRPRSGEPAQHEEQQSPLRSCPSSRGRVASMWHRRLAEIRADLFPCRSDLSKQRRVPLGSPSSPL